ncbi:hypothetical protein AVEN_253902-1, partial [Araneus ventricosus]
MTTFENVNFSFPKLNATNYTTWKVDMKVFLLDRGSWEFIEGDPKPCSDDSSEQEKRIYEFRKVRAYTSIYQSVERQFQPLMAGITDGLDKDEFTVKNIELQLINEFGRVQQKRKDELHRNVANAYETRISRKAEDGKSLGTRSGFVLEPTNRSKRSYQH